MADILAEFFAQFNLEERARIRAAEAQAKVIIAQGASAIWEPTGPPLTLGSILAPRDAARVGAAGALFVGYQRALFQRVADPLSPESIQELVRQLDRVSKAILNRYGFPEDSGALNEVRAEAEQLAWSSHGQQLARAKATPIPEQLAIEVATARSVEDPSQRIAEGAMPDMLALSNPAKRRWALQWETLRENHKLTEEDLSEYDRRRQHLTEVSAKWPRHDSRHRDPRYATQAARWLGVTPSVTAAEAAFRRLGPGMGAWCASGEGYETYAASLDSVKRDIVAELESIWKGRSAATDRWFQQTCAPAIQKALAEIAKPWIAQARDFEVQRLERSPGTRLATATNPILEAVIVDKDHFGPLSPKISGESVVPHRDPSMPAATAEAELAASDPNHSAPGSGPDGVMDASMGKALIAPDMKTTGEILACSNGADGEPLQWEDIEIRFTSEHRVQTFVCDKPRESMNYADMGFEDRRGGGGKPVKAWDFLMALSQNGDGIYPAAKIFGDQSIQKRAQDLRDRLAGYFGIAGDPLPFVEGIGYRGRFKIRRSPGFDS
jgi:hypothetical protein